MPLVSTISRDGGRTWTQRRIEGLPTYARAGGWFRGGVALDDGTVLGSISLLVTDGRVSSTSAAFLLYIVADLTRGLLVGIGRW